MFNLRLSWLFPLVLAACGGASAAPEPLPAHRADQSPPPPKGNADKEAEAKGDVTDREAVAAIGVVFDRLARGVLNAGGDCGRAAGVITDAVRANSSLWQHLSAMRADPTRAVLLDDAAADIEASMQRFADALGPCAGDQRVHRSLEGMNGADH